jgi:hypothetical protein
MLTPLARRVTSPIRRLKRSKALSAITRLSSGPKLKGIRYPNNQCMNCAYRGLCLKKKALVEENLVKVEELAVHG